MRHGCGKRIRRSRRDFWPYMAMAAAGSNKGWDGFGSNFPFGDDIPFGANFPFGDDGPFGKGRGRRGRMVGSGELRLLLLHLIAAEARHGYELIKAIEVLTGGAYSPSPGTVYPTLSMMADEAVVDHSHSDETRKAYEVTEAGSAELEERAGEVEALIERLSGHAKRRRAYATPEMFRAVGNLASVLKNRARSGKLDEDTIEEIVDIIDEVAKRIERL